MMMEEALAFITAGDLEGALFFAAVEWLAAPLSSSWWKTKHIVVVVELSVFLSAARTNRLPSHLGQVGELPLRDDGAPPQVVDADVVGRRGHGRLHVVVVAEGPPGHPDGEPHPRILYGCGRKQGLKLISHVEFRKTGNCWEQCDHKLIKLHVI